MEGRTPLTSAAGPLRGSHALPLPPDLDRPAPGRPWVPLGLWLPAYGLVVLGLLAWRMPSPTPGARPTSVRVSLAAFDPPIYAPPPGPAPGPSGGSHRLGTGTIDPGLLALPALVKIRVPPTQLATLTDLAAPPLQLPLTLDKSLPVRPGGNGVPKGDGAGFGRGHGNGVGDGSGGGGSAKLQLVRSVTPDYPPGTKDGESVTVQLLVGSDGTTLEAVPLTGRPELHAAVLKAAFGWQFRVPKAFASRAPFRVTVEFTYHRQQIQGPRGNRYSEVQELTPVVIR